MSYPHPNRQSPFPANVCPFRSELQLSADSRPEAPTLVLACPHLPSANCEKFISCLEQTLQPHSPYRHKLLAIRLQQALKCHSEVHTLEKILRLLAAKPQLALSHIAVLSPGEPEELFLLRRFKSRMVELSKQHGTHVMHFACLAEAQQWFARFAF